MFVTVLMRRKVIGVVRKLAVWEFPVVLHMDATFKLNKNEFPVVILGVSDAAQSLYMMSVSVISHRTQQMYNRVVRGSRTLFSQ
jgi:hypothetical protein